MLKLELRIPPPVVMVLSGLLAFFMSGRSLEFIIEHTTVNHAIWPIFFLVLGVAIAVSGVKEFSRFKTTISPLNPHKTSSVVNSGIYRFSRNPMYLGMLLLLLGWADYLGNFMAFSGALFFILYITRFQIQPEERVLQELFKEDYQQYMQTVRRWL